MILRIKNSDSTVTTLSSRGMLKILSGDTYIRMRGERKTVTFSQSVPDYNEWYSTVINKKQLAIFTGGSGLVGRQGAYSFAQGIAAYTKSSSGHIYLRTFQKSSPDTDGNMQLLPGKTLDVIPTDAHKVVVSRLDTEIPRTTKTVLRELNIFVWYLYHALNSTVYRLLEYSPYTCCRPMFTTSRLWGTIPSYQALIARWKRGFTLNINKSRETLTFSLGYTAADCDVPFVRITAVLTKQTAASPDTTGFLTLYSQGVSTDLNATPVRTIVKSDGVSSISLSGNGSDDWSAQQKAWTTITTTLTISNMSQGNYYTEAFSLAVALNESTTLFYDQTGSAVNTYLLTVSWEVSDSTGESKTYTETRTVESLAILLKEPEDAS